MTRSRARPSGAADQVVPGKTIGDPIDIDRLICPLRYDVQVRIDFIRLLRDEWALYTTDLRSFLDRPASRAYYTWFRQVSPARLPARTDASPEIMEQRFLRRVGQTAKLWQSIQQDGYDLSTPIGLRTGRTIRSVNGKTINTEIFAGNGCHRMACLSVGGRARLEPEHYIVRVRPEFTPRDNTAALLDVGALDMTTYLAFISGFYCDGVILTSASEIRRHVAAAKPALLSELDSVFAFDLPRVTDGSRLRAFAVSGPVAGASRALGSPTTRAGPP